MSEIAVFSLSSKRSSYYFWLFIAIHTCIWTMGPSLTRMSIPHDTLEGITWGLQWQLSYYKHPFLTAWLCAGITELFGTVGWPVYLLAQLAVSITFIASWQLAKKILAPTEALIAVLILDGVLFYNINSFNITPDTLQSPMWALLSLNFYQALNTQRIKFWLLTGLCAALCVCTKYQVLVLLIPMLFLCFLNAQARMAFKKPGVYLAFIIFLVLLIPHFIWLYHHAFITLDYAQHIGTAYTPEYSSLNHLIYPLQFFSNILLVIAGLFILIWPFYTQNKKDNSLDLFQKHFLLCIGLGPLLVSLFLCSLTGDYFPLRWSTPYFFPLGIMVLAYLKPSFSSRNMTRFTTSFILFSSLLFVIRMTTLTVLPRAASDAYLPNQRIALSLSQLWKKHYENAVPYIAGSSYLIAAIAPYMPDMPQVYFNWDTSISPWINEQDLRKKGGLFIWDEGGNYIWDAESATHRHLSRSILKRFPTLKNPHYYTFYRLSDHHPITIGVAILPVS